MKSIITVTVNPAVDKYASVQKIEPDIKLRCTPPRFEPGGGGLNVSRAIMKLGGTSRAVTTAGGEMGRMLLELLEEEGIETSSTAVQGQTRENLTLYEESTGEQFRFGMPGPSISRDEWEMLLVEVESAELAPDFIVASGSLPRGAPENFYSRIAEIASRSGSKMILDTSGVGLKISPGAGIYMIKPNRNELEQFAGGKLTTLKEMESTAYGLVRNAKCQILVVSLGPEGALLVSEEGPEWISGPQVETISSIGAGDSMVAGIVMKLAQDHPVREAVKFGVACGAAAVMTPGSELCRKEDAFKLYKDMLS
ncbi:MAG: 1-phosphofructokinase family hexose kinase [bacterium]